MSSKKEIISRIKRSTPALPEKKDGKILPFPTGREGLAYWRNMVHQSVNTTGRSFGERDESAREVASLTSRAEEAETRARAGEIDERTGLVAADESFRRLELAAKQTERTSEPTTVLIGDVNGLKDFNDTYGHPAGNKLLRTAGDILNSEIRAVDLAGRIGGDEVLIILNNTTPQESIAFWDRVNAKLVQAGIRISAGASLLRPLQPGEKIENLIADADKAQYVSKFNSKQGAGSQPQLMLFEDLSPQQLKNIRTIMQVASARPAKKTA